MYHNSLKKFGTDKVSWKVSMPTELGWQHHYKKSQQNILESRRRAMISGTFKTANN